MANASNTAPPAPEKPHSFEVDKIMQHSFAEVLPPEQRDALTAWVTLYYQSHVHGSPEKTADAKTADLDKFLAFFKTEVGRDHVVNWTPAVTKHFQQALKKTILSKTG